MKRFYIVSSWIVVVLAAGAFLFSPPKEIIVLGPVLKTKVEPVASSAILPLEPEARLPAPAPAVPRSFSKDLPNQSPLPNPPTIVKALYSTAWAAGSASKLKYLIGVIKKANLNGIVIDIKDYSGYVAYHTGIPEVEASGAENEIRIFYPNALLKQLHDNNIYVIGRLTVFQDPILAKAHPEWAVHNSLTGKGWTDRNGLGWMDPGSRNVWDYNIEIAKDALTRGFDEINFDYIRFPSDGNLNSMTFGFWDENTPMRETLRKFFKYLRDKLGDAKISADLFGLATVESQDLGIGQVIEDAYSYFDYVSPMVYPSHYHAGFLGYKNPAKYPYEVVKYSMESALQRLRNYELGIRNNGATITTTTATTTLPDSSFIIHNARLRPWLQAFDLGAVYDKAMIQKQIKAVEEVLRPAAAPEQNLAAGAFAGWLLWDPANIYQNL
jgi:hypothetical protein